MHLKISYFIILVLFSLSTRLWAQCLAPTQFSMMPPSAMAGGQFSQRFLIAPPQYYQPLNYYGPQVQMSPMLVPCGHHIRYGSVPLNLPQPSPTFNAFQAAMPALMGTLPQLGELFTRNSGEPASHREFMARAYADRERRPHQSTTPALEFTSAYRDLDWATSPGTGAPREPTSQTTDPLTFDDRELPFEEEEGEQDSTRQLVAPPEPETPMIGPRPRVDIPPSQGREDITDEQIDELLAQREVPTLAPPTVPEGPPQIDTSIPAAPTVEEAVSLAQEGLEYTRTAGVPIEPDCTSTLTAPHPLPPLVHGAYRVMANFYQSCDVLDILLDENTELGPAVISVSEQNTRTLSQNDRQAYIEGHPYLARLNEQAQQTPAQCRNILEQPPIFALGSKASMERQGPNMSIDLFRNQSRLCAYSGVDCDSDPVSALDCSGFIQTALTVAGRRIYKDGRNNRQIGTAGLLEAAHDPDSCVSPAQFSQQGQLVQTLQEGDMVTGHAHHMFMVTKVGDDPLGVNRAIEREDCSSITIDDFDFELIQSGAGRSLGVARMNTRFVAQSQSLLTRLLFEAQKTCQESLTQQELSPAMVQTSRKTEFMVIRYSGEDDPACHIDSGRVIMEGEECLADCSPLERVGT